jgi:hypothetical protein
MHAKLLQETLLRKPPKVWQWCETLCITGIFILLCWWARPNDPLTLNAAFPWIVFAPILVALRYGTLSGMTSVIIVAITMYYFYPNDFFSSTTVRLFLLGNIFITVLCGEWYLAWEADKLQLYRINEYAVRRLNNLNKAYYLLRLSHEQLEQAIIAQPFTLRNAMQIIKHLLIETKGEINETIAHQFLQLVCRYVAIESIQLFFATDGVLNTKPFASIGNDDALILEDPLIKKALESSELVHIGMYDFETKKSSMYFVAMPLRDNDEHLIGLLAIKELSFWGADESNLKALSIIVTSFADQLWIIRITKKLTEVYSDCPLEFAEELYRMLHLRKTLKVRTMLSVFILEASNRTEDVLLTITKQQRGVDSIWRHQLENKKYYLFVLMPFSAGAAIEGFKNRFAKVLKENYGIILNQSEVYLRYVELFSNDPVENIKQLMTYADQI